MTKGQNSIENKYPIRVIRWEKNSAVTEEEAEARLHQEGYESFRWYDVPGASYPKHRHDCDECLWILKGEIHFTIADQTYVLKAGDRIYLPARAPHTAAIPQSGGVTYLVGQKNSHS
jgi:quercetin dioxygenase-like cupin family protein